MSNCANKIAKSITKFVVIKESGIFLNKKFIRNIITEVNIECGTKTGTIHIYIMVKIAYYIQVYLDYKKINCFSKRIVIYLIYHLCGTKYLDLHLIILIFTFKKWSIMKVKS